jgi:hypothetical protein
MYLFCWGVLTDRYIWISLFYSPEISGLRSFLIRNVHKKYCGISIRCRKLRLFWKWLVKTSGITRRKETDNERDSDKYGELILPNNVSMGANTKVRVFSPPAVGAMQPCGTTWSGVQSNCAPCQWKVGSVSGSSEVPSGKDDIQYGTCASKFQWGERSSHSSDP